MAITLKCNAKVNLSLDIVGKRDDGYHNIELIFDEVGLYDILTVALRDDGIVRLECDDKTLPTDDKNIAYRAALEFIKKSGVSFGAEIKLKKNIPHGAGLGGGSSDAAGVLNAMNELTGFPLNDDELKDVGAKLGADVPFFINGGCAFAEGIGEILTPLKKPENFVYVIAKPEESISTAYVYKNIDLKNRPNDFSVRLVAEGLNRGDYDTVFKHCGNIMESVTEKECPIIKDIKECMLTNGAKMSLMSGSGTAVFGVFDNKNAAETAAKSVFKFTDKVYLA